eukprot:4195958-Pyramimonas_sp.AAC.1
MVARTHGTSPFGGSAVRDQWPCLGAVVVSRAAEGDDPPRNGGLTKEQEEALCKGSWDRPLPRIRERALVCTWPKCLPPARPQPGTPT